MEYKDVDGNPVSLDKLCRTEPEWAANRIKAEQQRAEKAEADLTAYKDGVDVWQERAEKAEAELHGLKNIIV